MRRSRFSLRVLELLEARGVGITSIGRSRWALSVSRGKIRLIVANDRKQPAPYPLSVTLESTAGDSQA